jgi:threonine/homoserine/homoserine lactone efflux protein
MEPSVLMGLAGVLQGARHALEPDHVSAVATVVVEAPSSRRAVFYAGCWGLGHASMLLLVGGPLVALRAPLPGKLTMLLELAVGVMLVYLGVQTLRGGRAASRHAEGHEHAKPLVVRGRRPFAIGVVHGLAGSGALAALIALGAPTVVTGLASIGLYAVGTVIGMVALASVAGPVLARAGQLPELASVIGRIAGAVSIGVGIVWAAHTLFFVR